MNKREQKKTFQPVRFTQLTGKKKDGVPVYAIYNKWKRDIEINLASPMHSIIIGATGSGKTTGFINPMIQILAKSGAGSSFICTDPKGELYQLHSGFLDARGYDVKVLDLREPYSSYRWNPLGDLYDRYQIYLQTGNNINCHTDSIKNYKLERINFDNPGVREWYEFDGKAFGDRNEMIAYVKTEKQKIFDEIYEDLNDLISVLCPVENQDEPLWEKGAKSVVMAVCLAMLEDSEDPALGMTREKYCFYNVARIIGNSEDEFAELKKYFEGRDVLSKATSLSRQVLSTSEQTLSSYMSIAYDKLSIFNDEGICALTSETDIKVSELAKKPTALFLKIPDEKDTRHVIASIFVLCVYKALIKEASLRESLSLPRNVYFILDEFGNMPKIDKFDKMITVGRSRKIWFQMVIQSYAQLNNVYGDKVANIIKGNCGIKMFIGSNDIETCEEFSKLCGNMTISTSSVSSSTSDTRSGINVSSQLQTRPIIYPSELQKLNNNVNTGNAIVVTFGNFPLKTKFTPSYKCPLYVEKKMKREHWQSNSFFGEDVFYDIRERNLQILSAE
ncbi:MAG: type IV secretory system conjugative DNA transfer family protein [Clostridium sp.]|nr:type IV secretory system conjugative DNA transfer family protein [Clostridium sp.]